MPLIQTIHYIWTHPLNQGNKLAALNRYMRWQVRSRLLPGAAVVPFVDATRLLVSRGMAGATGNIYGGLHDLQEMGFILHALDEGEYLVDIGANVGCYSILAAGACGANVLAFEPVPATFDHLIDNIRLNRLDDKISAFNLGLGSKVGRVRFSALEDTTNHVLSENEHEDSSIQVEIKPLDDYLSQIGDRYFVIKLDVEGFEAEVLAGASKAISSSKLLAVIVEDNGCGNRYGTAVGLVGQVLASHALVQFGYDPQRRCLLRNIEKGANCNQIFIRDQRMLENRLRAARSHRIGNKLL